MRLCQPGSSQKSFRCFLRLPDFRAEQAVLLQAGLVLNDDHGDAHAFEGADRVDEMFREATRVAVEDDRLRGDLDDVVDGAEARGHVDKLDIGLALRRAVAERAHPHPVELLRAAVLVHAGLFHDEARDVAVGFHNGYETLHLKKLFEAGMPHVRERKLGFRAVAEVFVFLIVCIGEFDEPAAVGGQNGNDLVPDGFLESSPPFVAVNYEIRFELFKVLPVGKSLLFHDLGIPRRCSRTSPCVPRRERAGNACSLRPPRRRGRR